jgi:hypothetical protein
MKIDLKKISFFSVLTAAGLSFAPAASAICPICTVVVSSGVGLSRYLGVDDSISGLWIGGLTVSAIEWTLNWMEKKKIDFKGKALLTWLGYYALVLSAFYFTDFMENPIQTICSCAADKLFLGIVTGSAAFAMGASWYYYTKEKNGGKALFPFQKVAFPVVPLVLLIFFFNFLTK